MLPTKLLEYVAVGIPCIMPRTGTISRYFDDTMVEFFEAENVESLAAAIVTLRYDPERRATLAKEATRRFHRQQSLEPTQARLHGPGGASDRSA